jgi:hypothetical protein
MPADDLVFGVALDPLRARVPARNAPLRVQSDQGIIGDDIDEEPQLPVLFAQSCSCRPGGGQASARLVTERRRRQHWVRRYLRAVRICHAASGRTQVHEKPLLFTIRGCLPASQTRKIRSAPCSTHRPASAQVHRRKWMTILQACKIILIMPFAPSPVMCPLAPAGKCQPMCRTALPMKSRSINRRATLPISVQGASTAICGCNLF